MMNEPDLVATVKTGIVAFLEELNRRKVSDSDYPYWLSSAAINVCLAVDDVELQDMRQNIDDLARAVKNGFEQLSDRLNSLSEEDRDSIESSQAYFVKAFEGKLAKGKAHEEEVVEKSKAAKETSALVCGNEEVKEDLQTVSTALSTKTTERKTGKVYTCMSIGYEGQFYFRTKEF